MTGSGTCQQSVARTLQHLENCPQMLRFDLGMRLVKYFELI
jgi:hypothetical protein